MTAPDRAELATIVASLDAPDLRIRLEHLAGRVGDVPPPYVQHVLAIIQRLEELLDEMVDR